MIDLCWYKTGPVVQNNVEKCDLKHMLVSIQG